MDAYVLTPLPVGFYDVLVELEGFRSHSVKRLKVDAAMRATVDVRLDIGQMSESTTVQANTAILQSETGQIGRLIEGRQVVDLTLAGRNPIVLPLMKAGVVGSNFSVFNPTSLDGAALSISGGQRAGNNITFDGVPAIRTRIETSGAMLGQLNPDAVEEVQILTSTYRAEYGRAMDGQVRFVTKSGTQNFHGSGSYFFRDERFDANSWLRNRSPNASENSGPAPYEFGQPGYTIGGPDLHPRTLQQQPLEAVLLRVAGMDDVEARSRRTRRRCRRRRCGVATSASCSIPRIRSSGASARSSTRAPVSRSRATSSPRIV